MFWVDIMAKYEDATGTVGHFMGAIVSLPVTTVPVGVQKHLIIDGQQRLTTLAVLLRALKDFVSETNSGIIGDLLVNRHRQGAERPKFLPTQRDRDVLNCLLCNETTPNDPHLLIKCNKYFCKKLDGKDEDNNQIKPDRILEIVRTHLNVVSIGLDAEEDPYEIFESLNYKGQPLTPADLVRNHVMMRFRHAIEPGGEQQQIYDGYWKPIEDLFKDKLTSFLRHYYMKEGEDVRETGVYAAAKRRFNKAETPEEVRAELDRLRRHARYYKCFLDPSLETRMPIADKLRALSRVDVSTSYPLLLKVFAVADELRISEGELGDVLKTLESFVLRRMICGIPGNSLGRIFLQCAL